MAISNGKIQFLFLCLVAKEKSMWGKGLNTLASGTTVRLLPGDRASSERDWSLGECAGTVPVAKSSSSAAPPGSEFSTRE